jgi:hypothetical protein
MMTMPRSPLPLSSFSSLAPLLRLCPAIFRERQGSPSNVRPLTNPAQHRLLFNDEPTLHWSLTKQIDPSKYLTLFARLPHKLSASNYILWMFAAEATLDTINLLSYVNGEIPTRKIGNDLYPAWRAANALIRSILVTNMTEEVAIQMSHLQIVSEIWDEAKHLFSRQTMTDFTLTITSLVTMKYVDGEDISAHIAKMRSYRCDLTLMSCDIDNGLFACFLHISMPLTWNYVFASLPQSYTSAEVEQQIKDEHGIKANQESVTVAYRAMQTTRMTNKTSPGDPFCMNCNKPGQWIKACWVKGSGAEGKGPHQKQRQNKKKSEDKKKHKGKNKAHQAVHDNDSDAGSHSLHASYMAVNTSTPSSSQF